MSPTAATTFALAIANPAMLLSFAAIFAGLGLTEGQGGVVVLTGALNKIVEINEADMYAVVQTGDNSVPVVRTYEVTVAVARISLFDARTRQPVWSTSAETTSQGSLSERADSLRKAMQKAMAAYPPS